MKQYDCTSHTVYRYCYHIVWIAKYRYFNGYINRQVAPQLNVVTNTTDPRGVVAYVRDARVAWVVSSAAAGHETTVVPGPSSSDR